LTMVMNRPEAKPKSMDSIYDWPIRYTGDGEVDDPDLYFYQWADDVRKELEPVYETLMNPLPDDPTLLDSAVTEKVEGWAPRVALLMVRAEWWLNNAKKAKWPAKTAGADGKATTEADRTAVYHEALADHRFVRDELENMLTRLIDRMRWAQSVRKVHNDAG
jgi:hypothetical protein